MTTQNTAVTIEVLTQKEQELEDANAEIPLLGEEIKKLKTECIGAKDANKNLQRMCAYMTRSATDATKRRGK